MSCRPSPPTPPPPPRRPKRQRDTTGGAAQTTAASAGVTQERGGVSFDGPLALGYRACLWSRLAQRVLLRLVTLRLDGDPETFWAGLAAIDWSAHLSPDGTLAVDFAGLGAGVGVTNTLFGAQRTKDVVVDQFRERFGRRPRSIWRAPTCASTSTSARAKPSWPSTSPGRACTAAATGPPASRPRRRSRRRWRRPSSCAPAGPRSPPPAAASSTRCAGRARCPSRPPSSPPTSPPGCCARPPARRAQVGVRRLAGPRRRAVARARWRRRASAAERRSPACAAPARAAGGGVVPLAYGYDRDTRAVDLAQADVGRAGLGELVRIERRDLAAFSSGRPRALPQPGGDATAARPGRRQPAVRPPAGRRRPPVARSRPHHGTAARTERAARTPPRREPERQRSGNSAACRPRAGRAVRAAGRAPAQRVLGLEGGGPGQRPRARQASRPARPARQPFHERAAALHAAAHRHQRARHHLEAGLGALSPSRRPRCPSTATSGTATSRRSGARHEADVRHGGSPRRRADGRGSGRRPRRARRRRRSLRVGPAPLSPAAEQFANRLRKNARRWSRYMRRAGIGCYRVYDADLPDYSVAIDVYERWVHVQEYAPPPEIDEARAAGRLAEAMRVIPEVLGAAPADVFLKVRARQRGAAQYCPARHHRRRARGPRARADVPRQLHRLPRHRAVPARARGPAPAGRAGERAAVPQPLRLHRHGQRGGRQGRRREHDDRRPERPLPGVGAAQLRRQQAQAGAQRGDRGRRPDLGGADRRALRAHLPRPADLLELQEDGARDLRRAPRPRRPDPPGRPPPARARRRARLRLQRAAVHARRREPGPRPPPRGPVEGDAAARLRPQRPLAPRLDDRRREACPAAASGRRPTRR